MKIAIDARQAYATQKAGKGQWTKGFIEELLSRDADVTLLTEDMFPSGIRWHFHAATYVKNNAYDAYISPTSMIVPAILASRVPCITMIHDLIAFRSEPHSLKAKIIERLLLRSVVKHAAHICTISEATTVDLVERFPSADSKTTAIYAGPMSSAPQKNSPDGKTILCAGTLCPRKNQLRLIRAFASLPEELRASHRLVLVGGRGWNDQEIVDLCEKVKGVEWKDYVTDDEYQELLSSATVLAHPSLYEGFGLQVLDALQRGIPVMTADRGSLSEVVGDAALLIDPEDDVSIAQGLQELLQNDELRQNLASQGPEQAKYFTWKRTVDLFLESLEKALY
jgi:glycosyltransferase involved in cell wall biosynthesis